MVWAVRTVRTKMQVAVLAMERSAAMHTMQPWRDTNNHGIRFLVLAGLLQHFVVVLEYLTPFPLVPILPFTVLFHPLLHS